MRVFSLSTPVGQRAAPGRPPSTRGRGCGRRAVRTRAGGCSSRTSSRAHVCCTSAIEGPRTPRGCSVAHARAPSSVWTAGRSAGSCRSSPSIPRRFAAEDRSRRTTRGPTSAGRPRNDHLSRSSAGDPPGPVRPAAECSCGVLMAGPSPAARAARSPLSGDAPMTLLGLSRDEASLTTSRVRLLGPDGPLGSLGPDGQVHARAALG
jgi:hypothetical protein